MRQKLIEVALPLDAINAASAREKSIRHGHPSTLHLWWARRPLAAARAVIFAQMVDDPSEYVDVLLSDAVKKRAAQRELKKRLAARATAAAAPPATGNGNIGAGEKPGGATVEAETRAPTLDDVAAELERARLFGILEGAACETPGACGLAQPSILLVNTHLPWIADGMPLWRTGGTPRGESRAVSTCCRPSVGTPVGD